jgi:predicted MFS family arabinose efflux permease
VITACLLAFVIGVPVGWALGAIFDAAGRDR